MVPMVKFHEAFATHRCTKIQNDGERDSTDFFFLLVRTARASTLPSRPYPFGTSKGRAHALAQITPSQAHRLYFFMQVCWIGMGVFVFLKAM